MKILNKKKKLNKNKLKKEEVKKLKKIINGKVYDIGTAEHVGEWSNEHYTNDSNYCSEDLYRKKTGEFFLHGVGGAYSKYAVVNRENRGNGEKNNTS